MTQETKQRLEKIHLQLKDNGLINLLTLDDAVWLLDVIAKQGEEIEKLSLQVSDLSRGLAVISAARGLMVDLGRGNRDVSFALAEIHNSLRALDNKDYLTSKPGIIV